jgi:hypothetical protein
MDKRIPAILLAGLVSANAWPASDAGTTAPAVQKARQAGRSLVTDLPYSALHTVTIRRLLPDGDEFTRQTVTRLYRDSAGRTRRDTLDSEGEPDHTVITGTDGATIFLDHKNELVSAGAGRPQVPLSDRDDEVPARARAAVEKLGRRDIEGVSATGRIVREQVGKEGEDIEATTESWYSAELKMTLYRRHSDPRFGDSTVEVSDLDRSEPDPALFEPPEDYQLLASHFRRN